MNRIKQGVNRLADIRFDKETGSEQKGADQMHLPVSVTQDELLEVLLQVAPVRPVFIWGAPGIYDALGDLFMALSSRKGQQAQGQFFTPVHICDLMVMCTETDEKKTGQRINDPTCGSGRLLLAYHVRHLGNYLVAEDVNRTCCLMTICNMLIHGCVGEVIHHDSLCPENFMDGWMVNHTLTQTGIPSIRRMSEEEYRTSRNMSVDLLRKRKEKLRQMQPDKKQLP